MHSKKFSWKALAPSVYEWTSTLIVALLVLVVFFTFFFRIVQVDGDSMKSTLKDGEQLLLLTTVTEYHHGDIVVVDRHTDEPLIKRVIALPGDTLEIVDNTVYLNGVLLQEPYALGVTQAINVYEPITVPSGYVFVMGDNRENSLDSRSRMIGLVYMKDIVGKAVWRVFPYRSFGGLYHNTTFSAGG